MSVLCHLILTVTLQVCITHMQQCNSNIVESLHAVRHGALCTMHNGARGDIEMKKIIVPTFRQLVIQ